MADDAELERAIKEKLTLPKYAAGRAIGWGKRATDAAVKAGQMPVIEGLRQRVPTSWLRQKLGLTKTA